MASLPHKTVFGPFIRDDCLTAAFSSPQVLQDTPEIFADYLFATTATVGTFHGPIKVLFINLETAKDRVKSLLAASCLLVLVISVIVGVATRNSGLGATIAGSLYAALAIFGAYILSHL